MKLQTTKNGKHKLNSDLTLDEELVLLVYKSLYSNEPFNLSIAVEPLNMSRQHISRMVRGLITRSYMKRTSNISVDLVDYNNELPINTNFIFTSDLTIDDKRMIILLYKTFSDKDYINTEELNALPEELTLELIETLMEEGVIMHNLPINFIDIFTLNSHYDL